MINKVPSFQVSDGKIMASLEEAKAEELRLLIGEADDFILAILKDSEKVIDILTTTETSLPKARKVNGGKKTRKIKAAAQAAANEAKADAIEAANEPVTA